MATIATASTTTPNIKTGDNWSISLDITDPLESAEITYLWSNGETTKDISGTATSPGVNTYSCVVTMTPLEGEPVTVTSNEVTITATNKTISATASASTTTPTIKVGQPWNVTAAVVGAPTNSTLEYKWSNGETTKDISGTGTVNGELNFTCEVTISATGYDTKTITTAPIKIVVNNNTISATASVSTTTPVITIGSNWNATVAITGSPANSTFAYKWSSGQTTKDISGTGVLGSITYYCDVTISASGYDTVTIRSSNATVTVKRPMNPKLTISTGTPTINLFDSYTATATVTDAPEGSAITYLWSNNSSAQSITGSASEIGKITLTCTSTISNADYVPNVLNVTSNELVINVVKTGIPVDFINLQISPEIPSKHDEEYSVSYVYETLIDGVTTTQVWDNGDISPTSNRISKFGVNSIGVDVTFMHPDYDPTTINKSLSFNIINPDSNNIRYIHPLNSRGSAFIWCGYWVLDEIQKATFEDIDWKKPDETDLKYKVDIRTILKMFEEYPHMEVMESRHGWVFKKEDFERGIFY